jgi:hypothetical protein
METNRINPGEDQPEPGNGPQVRFVPISIVDMLGHFAKMLDENCPPEDLGTVLASVCGTIAENISHPKWKALLATPVVPCGDEGCECHIHLARFLPELYNLKLAADEAQANVRDREGRGPN